VEGNIIFSAPLIVGRDMCVQCKTITSTLEEGTCIKCWKKLATVTDELYEGYKKVIDLIPECEQHGPQCLPNAENWIRANR
jgi:predicted amidophosphoribosyltransferase